MNKESDSPKEPFQEEFPDDLDEDFELDEEFERSLQEDEDEEKESSSLEEAQAAAPIQEEEANVSEKDQEEPLPVQTKRPEEILLADKVPLAISVELGQFHMSVAKLMQLGPGSTIDLNRRAEQGIDLVLFGKKIATGELVQVGDVLGIRIIDMGS